MSAALRGLRTALNTNGIFKYKSPDFRVDHVVIGGGIVGLAIARQLCQEFPHQSTWLIERHPGAGHEISSRNSEVIHSGLYYPSNSLKTRLCIQGRDLLYAHCEARRIDHQRVGKLVVARAEQRPYLRDLHAKAQKLYNVPTELISGDAARARVPELSETIGSALWCPMTGIVDSHGVMQSFEGDIIDSDSGQLVYSTEIVRVDPADDGWVLQTSTEDSMHAAMVINAAGLSAPLILNSVLPEAEWLSMYFARGSYASYSGTGIRIPHLIYPCPAVNGDSPHGFHSLGTHLTLDLQGKVRFGPDIEWLDAEKPDFWMKHLQPDDSRLGEMQKAVAEYLPDITLDSLTPDYVGIRPKLVPPSGGFQDFVVRVDGHRSSPMISLLGIESPGLTASMAIANHVVDQVVHKL